MGFCNRKLNEFMNNVFKIDEFFGGSKFLILFNFKFNNGSLICYELCYVIDKCMVLLGIMNNIL